MQQEIVLSPDLEWRGYGNAGLFQDTAGRISQLEQQLPKPPEDAGLPEYLIRLYTLAGLYWAKHDYSTALARFQQACAMAENRLPASFQAWCWNGSGDAHAGAGEYDLAVDAYRRAAELDPTSAYAWVGLGGVLGDVLARFDEAVAAYQQALDLGGLNPHLVAIVHNGLGNVFYLLGCLEEAATEYRLAVEVDPGFLAPHDNLGTLALRQGDLDEARRHFAERVHLRPQHSLGAYVSLGIIAWRQDDPESLVWFRKALEAVEPARNAKYETPAGILENQTLALLALGRPQEALAALEEMLAQRTSGDAIEFARWDLLRTSSCPPEGIDALAARLEQAGLVSP